MASSSSQLSPISCEKKNEIHEKYDVFLSFRGEDTRNTFASYLYAALSARQISTFMDDHELKRGDEISPTLCKAIEESKIWVIILSENYASSTWCLDELVHILECKKRNEQSVVMPIFYSIDPSIVRKQKESYGVAFAELEDRFKDNMEKVHQWKAALAQVSYLCGLNSKDFRPENKLIQQIVEDISKKLPKYLSSNMHMNGHLIGIEKKIKEIESKLCIGSKEVRIIGIWGMGGIGKTTLASVLFQRLSYSKFEGYSFLWNVREEYERYGPDHLRKKLLLGLLNHEAILRMDSPFVASPFIHNKLRHKKIFIVLDDVGSSVQLEALVGGYDQLAPGSRIIITTRNVQVLKKVTQNIYKVEGLNHSDSIELFHLNAFGKKSFARDHYEMLSIRVASYANGNPLALKVLGCFLHSKTKQEWEFALDKLKKVPKHEIQNVLRISFEGLDDKETQNIFLDIACLFSQNFKRDHAESILDFDDSFVKIGIRLLIHKSLIENSDSRSNNELRMHDLLRQMGRAIVRDEHKKPGNRSRLWDAKDVCQVLERNTGTAAVEGISFNLSEINRDVKVCPAALSKMYNLRIFKIYCDNIGDNNFKLLIPQSLDSYDLFDKLRYFQWDLYPLKSLPSKFSPKNLVELILRGSHVKRLWNHKIFQYFPILKRIDLSYSRFLTQLPDMSQAPNLESVNLEGCTNLVQVLSPLQNLQKLTYLNLNGCSNLRDLKEISRSTGYLDLVKSGAIKNLLSNICQLKFTSLKSFMQSFTNNLSLYSSQAHISHMFPKNLTILHLRGTSIEEVPSSIWCLSGLVQLDLGDCQRLKRLPTSICELKSLESIDLSGCLGLEKFPEILQPMENLTKLVISRAGLKGLPDSIENLISLAELSIKGCEGIEFLPNNLCNLRKLLSMNFEGCSKLEKLPHFPPALEYMYLRCCGRLKSLPELPSSCLNLDASYCTSLDKISTWRAPFLGPRLHHSQDSWFNFYGCQKLDHNTRNNTVFDCAVIRILSIAADSKEDEDNVSLKICYPGDEIPKWFSYQTVGPTMKIMLPPYWNNDNFLTLALCIVFDSKKYDPSLYVSIACKLTFKTTNDDHPYEFCDDFSPTYGYSIISSDHIFMWSFQKSVLRNSKGLIGLNWPCTCSTEASVHVQPSFYSFKVLGVENWGSEYCEIKKCGIRLVYKEDIERFVAETKSKRKRSFDEYWEASGSCEVGGFHEDSDDDQSYPMINSKKFKLV